MPQDQWAKAKAKQHQRQADAKQRSKPAWGRLRKVNGQRVGCSYHAAISRAKSDEELTAVARTIAVMHNAHKICDEHFRALLQAGKRKRQALAKVEARKSQPYSP